MDEGGENVQWERYVMIRRDEPQEVLDEPDIAMRRVGTVPLNVEAPDLLETCLTAFSKSPWISMPVYVHVASLVVGFIGVYIWMDHNVYLGLTMVVLAIVSGGISLYVLAMRGSHNTRAVQSTDRPNLPGHIQAPTSVVTWSRGGQRVDIDLGCSRSTSSSTETADLTGDYTDDILGDLTEDILDDFSDDFDVSGPSDLQPPVITISEDHFSRTLRSGKRTSGVISPRSDRPKALQEPAAGESPGRTKVSEVASSPSLVSRRKKISTRRTSIHEQHSPFASGSLSD